MALDVRIGYYGMWGATRDCDTYQPENIPAGALTHINLAFEYVSEDHEITNTQGSIVARVSRLKKKYPGLKVSIALGSHLILYSLGYVLTDYRWVGVQRSTNAVLVL